MDKITKDIMYIWKVIESCNTLEQLINCKNLIKNFQNKHYKRNAVSINTAYLFGYLDGVIYIKYKIHHAY